MIEAAQSLAIGLAILLGALGGVSLFVKTAVFLSEGRGPLHTALWIAVILAMSLWIGHGVMSEVHS